MKRVLVVGAHMDDAELGAGGTIAHLAAAGTEVSLVAFSTGTADRSEAEQAAELLGVNWMEVRNYATRHFPTYRQGILEYLIRLRDLLRPDVVLCPAEADRHQDHEVIAAEVWRAFRTTSTILGYELPWSCPQFNAQMLVPLEGEDIAKKMCAVRRYKSQAGKPYTRAATVWSLARVRGMQAGVNYAEAFEVIRWLGGDL